MGFGLISKYKESGMVKMKVRGLGCCPKNDMATVILEDLLGKRYLPLLVRKSEARYFSQIGQPASHPTLHDLILRILDQTAGKLREIILLDLKDSLFPLLEIALENTVLTFPCVLMDAIIFSIRSGALLSVPDKVVERFGKELTNKREETTFSRQWLEDLSPQDF